MPHDALYFTKIIATIFGGVVGLARVFHNRKMSKGRWVVEGLTTMIVSVAAMDYFFVNLNVVLCLFWGFIIGYLNGYFLDHLKSIAPKLSPYALRILIAKIFDLDIPQKILESPNSESELEKNDVYQEDVLSEYNDRNAIDFLDDELKPFPPRPITQKKHRNMKGTQKHE